MKFKMPSLATMPAWMGVLVLQAILLIAMAVTQPVFFSGSNLSNIIRSSAIPIVLGIGMTYTILTAGIDPALVASWLSLEFCYQE